MVFLLERKGLELVLIAKAEGGSVCKYSLFTGFFSLVLSRAPRIMTVFMQFEGSYGTDEIKNDTKLCEKLR